MNPKKSIGAIITLPLAALALLCGCHKQNEQSPVGSGTPIVSAEKTSFDEVTSKLDKGGNLYLYLSTEQVLGGLTDKMAGLRSFAGNMMPGGMTGDQSQTIGKFFDFADDWIKDSGIQEISGVGMSSIAREPGFYYSKIIVHHYPGDNDGLIWSLLGKEPHPLQELDLLPATTALAMFSDLDAQLLWKDIQKHVKQLDIPAATASLDQWPEQFRKMTGLEFDKVLDSMGGNYGIILTLDVQKPISLPMPGGAMDIPNPGLAIVMKVSSDAIFNRVDQLSKGNPLVERVNNPDLKMITMTIPLPLPVELRPSIARSGDYLLLATSDSLVQEILDVKAGKSKGFKSTAEFARISQGIPDEGNNFSLISDQFMRSVMQIQQQALTNKGTMTSAQVESMQHAFNNATNYSAYNVGVNGSEGWEGYANGSQSIQSVMLPLAAGVGVLAAVAIPNFIKARAASQAGAAAPQGNYAQPAAAPVQDPEAAQYNRILKNLRLLQTAKLKWAAENAKAAGDAVTMADLVPYLAKPIQPVADEEYDPQPVGALATARLAHDLHGHAAGSEISAPARKKKPAAN